MTRRREIITVWILLSAPIIGWVALMDIAVRANGGQLDVATHLALIVSMVIIGGLSVAIVEAAAENWRTICRYLSAMLVIESALLFVARTISGQSAVICAAVALIAALTLLFGASRI